MPYKDVRKAQKNQRMRKRKLSFDYLLGHPCVDCGESNPIVLEYDHRENKSFNTQKKVVGMTFLL